MRENFDFVTMDNYSADMADLSSQAAAIAASQRRDIQQLTQMIWMLVQASGGRIKIPYDVQRDYNRETAAIIVERMDHDMSTVVSAT